MAATMNNVTFPPKRVRRWRWLLFGIIPAALALGSWWLTEPLEKQEASLAGLGSPGRASTIAMSSTANSEVVWPASELQGDAAKTLVLDALLVANDRLNRHEGYTATLRKQERLKGKLGPVQTLEMKVRRQPFAVYFKFLSPQAGKEVVYAEGHYDNKLIAHSGGVARLLVPRLAVPPDHPLALADSRHPVTEAGLANLVERLLKFRRLDMADSDAITILDRVTDGSGREWLRSVHLHSLSDESRPFARIEVLYDSKTFIPFQIRNFDWPNPGQSGDLLLAEEYVYENVDFESQLSALDFDPANPNYAFHRY